MFREGAETNENVFSSIWCKSIGIMDGTGSSALCCNKYHTKY